MVNPIIQGTIFIESAFNIGGSIPKIAEYSGFVRIVFGVSQLAIGIFCLTLSILHKCDSRENWNGLIGTGRIFFLHGMGNYMRGWSEFLLAQYSFFAPLSMGFLQFGRSYYFIPKKNDIIIDMNGFTPLYKYQ